MMDLLGLAGLLALVLGYATFSQRLELSPVTMPIVFTAAGFLAAQLGFATGEDHNQFSALHTLAEVTLILILFSDASQVRVADLRRSIGIPARLLLLAMPMSIALGTGVAWMVSPNQPWTLALLVAAILTPTDAALGQSVVTAEDVPRRLREGIAVEGGLNDGLALPVVIIAALAATQAAGGVVEGAPDNLYSYALLQIVLGPLAGVMVGAITAKIYDKAVDMRCITESYRGIYFLAASFLCFIIAEMIGGNGLIAAFIGGLVFGNLRKDQSHFVAEFMESEGQLLTMATFFIFGAILVPLGLEHASWQAVLLALAFISIVRIIPAFLSLAGSGLAARDKMFLGWFGPRGLASILFALLVVEKYDVPGVDELVACVVLTVTLSIFVHGASAHLLVRAYTADKKSQPVNKTG